MCGIVGYASSSPVNADRTFFKQALYVDALRGKDSTGVFAIDGKTEKLSIVKYAVEAGDFISTQAFKEFEKAVSNPFTLMVGHNRAATKGAVTARNAHPFRHNHITMVHNGSLWFHDNLNRGDDFNVDSEAICYSLATMGTIDTLESLCGAYALVWHDSKKDKLFFARNKDRPLTVAISEDKKSIYWASEMGMLQFLLNRAGIVNTEFYDVTPEILFEVDLKLDDLGDSFNIVDTWEDEKQVSWGTPGNSRGAHGYGDYYDSYYGTDEPKIGQVFKDAVIKEIYPYQIPNSDIGRARVMVEYKGAPLWINVYDLVVDDFLLGDLIDIRIKNHSYYDTSAEVIIDKGPVEDDDVPFEIEVDNLVFGYGGVMVSEKEFGEQVQDGCAWCSQSVTPEDAEEIMWMAPRSFLCPDCVEEDIMKGYVG